MVAPTQPNGSCISLMVGSTLAQAGRSSPMVKPVCDRGSTKHRPRLEDRLGSDALPTTSAPKDARLGFLHNGGNPGISRRFAWNHPRRYLPVTLSCRPC